MNCKDPSSRLVRWRLKLMGTTMKSNTKREKVIQMRTRKNRVGYPTDFV